MMNRRRNLCLLIRKYRQSQRGQRNANASYRKRYVVGSVRVHLKDFYVNSRTRRKSCTYGLHLIINQLNKASTEAPQGSHLVCRLLELDTASF